MQISFHKLAQTSFKLKILRYLSIHGFNVTPFAANLLPRICYGTFTHVLGRAFSKYSNDSQVDRLYICISLVIKV